MAVRVPLPAHDPEGVGHRSEHAEVAFEDLWRHRAALRDLCQRIVGDAATADDVVQETYLRALANLDRLEQRPSLMPWLATVARRRSIDELRRRRHQRPVEATPDDPTRPELDPGEAAGLRETVAKVRQALTALSDRERELLTRQVNQGLSLSELADFDRSSVASVRSVLSRARTKLRDALGDTGTWVLAPAGWSGAWIRRKFGELGGVFQRLSPMTSGGYERVGEMARAAGAVAALAIGGLIPVAGAAHAETSAEAPVRAIMAVGGDHVTQVGVPTTDGIVDVQDDGHGNLFVRVAVPGEAPLPAVAADDVGTITPPRSETPPASDMEALPAVGDDVPLVLSLSPTR